MSNPWEHVVGDIAIVAPGVEVPVEGGILKAGDICLILEAPPGPGSTYKVQSALKSGFLFPIELGRTITEQP